MTKQPDNARGAPDPAACSPDRVAALREAYESHGDRVYRTARHVLGQAADAEDAVQDVFLRLLDGSAPLPDADGFSAWMYRITVNHCLNVLKRKRRDPAPAVEDAGVATPAPDDASPLRAAERAEARDHAAHLLARLAVQDRTILALREIEGLSYREIGDVLDLPQGTVMSRLSRARERLAAIVERNPQEVM